MEHRLEALLCGTAVPWAKPDRKEVVDKGLGWFDDLLRHPPPPGAVQRVLQRIPTRVLSDPSPSPHKATVRRNVSLLWLYAVTAWRSRDPIRTQNAAELVAALAGPLLARNLPPLAILGLMCSSVANADTDLDALVAALTVSLETLAAQLPSQGAVREANAATQLLLVWLARAGRSSLASTFLQPDLFGPLRGLLAAAARHPDLTPLVARTSLVLSLLYVASCAPASLRLTPQGTLDAAAAAAHASKCAHNLVSWDANPELAAASSAGSQAFSEAIQAYDPDPIQPASSSANQTWAAWLSTNLWPSSSSSPRRSSQTPKTVPSALPPAQASLWLPVFFLCNLNHRFLDVLLTSNPPGPAPVVEALSLASYLATNASASSRATSYAHLALSTLNTILVRAPTAAIVPLNASTVHLATARYGQPSTPAPTWFATPPANLGPATAHYTLYIASSFMRHNLARRLDGVGHALALRTWALSLAALARCSHATQPQKPGKGMDWHSIWTAVLGVPLFLHAKFDSLDATHVPGALVAGRAAIFALAQGIALAPKALPPSEAQSLVYEVLRAEQALASLASRTATGSVPTPGWSLLEAVIVAVKRQLGHSPGRLTYSTICKAIQRVDLPSLLANLPAGPSATSSSSTQSDPTDDLLVRLGLKHPEPVPQNTLSSAVWAVAEDACSSP